MKTYDHSQLVAGDRAVYGSSYGFGHSQWQIKPTTVDRVTATQLIMVDGARFRRDTGRRVGSRDSDKICKLLDPKGPEVRDTLGLLESQSFGYTLAQWDKERRSVRSLAHWRSCINHLEALVKEAQARIDNLQKEWE